jgi:hypothetical protein
MVTPISYYKLITQNIVTVYTFPVRNQPCRNQHYTFFKFGSILIICINKIDYPRMECLKNKDLFYVFVCIYIFFIMYSVHND